MRISGTEPSSVILSQKKKNNTLSVKTVLHFYYLSALVSIRKIIN